MLRIFPHESLVYIATCKLIFLIFNHKQFKNELDDFIWFKYDGYDGCMMDLIKISHLIENFIIS